MNSLPYATILLLALLSACCEETLEDCPCFTQNQFPIYKGCGQGYIYDSANNQCSTSGIYAQLYDAMIYPPAAREDSIEGRVTIAFDIFENGAIGNYTVVKDTLGYGLADAAIAAIKTLNDRGFCPARNNCEPYVYHYTLPVLFVLQ